MSEFELDKCETHSKESSFDRKRLVIPSKVVEKLRSDLIQEDGIERYALVHCSPSGEDLLVSGVDVVPDEDMARQSKVEARPKLSVERDILGGCAMTNGNPLIVHSHPFADHAGFSSADVKMMEEYRNWLLGLYPEINLSFGVLGKKNLETAIYNHREESFESLQKRIIGNWKLDSQLEEEETGGEVDRELHDRNIRVLTEDGQSRIASTKVAIVGAGSIGSILVEELARLGANDFVLIDHDEFEKSNIPRVFGAYRHHVGRPKVEVLKNHLWRINPDARVEAVQKKVEAAERHLRDVDVILAGVDQVSARSFINEFAVRHLKYYIDAGSVIETDDDTINSMEGYLQLVAPGSNACFDCLDRGNPEKSRLEHLTEDEREEEIHRGYIEGTDLAPEPAVVHLNSTVASLAVSVFSKLVTGFSNPPDLIRYDALENELVEINTRRNSKCITCGDDGVLGKGNRQVRESDVDVPEETTLDLELSSSRENAFQSVEDADVEPESEESSFGRIGSFFRWFKQ